MLRTFLFSQLISQISMAKFHVFCKDTLIEISVGDEKSYWVVNWSKINKRRVWNKAVGGGNLLEN